MRTSEVSQARRDELIGAYEAVRQKILQGDERGAACALEEIKREKAPISFFAKFLQLRLALKSGQISEEEAPLRVDSSWDSYFKAEGHLINGFLCYYKADETMGISHFRKAKTFFRATGAEERALVAEFNELFGRSNTQSLEVEEELTWLRHLHKRSFELGSQRLQGLVWRQKSFLYAQVGRFYAALSEVEASLLPLELFAPKADYDLALVQAAYCSLKTGAREKAHAFLEKVLAPMDRRNQLPRDFVVALLHDKTLDPKWYEVVPRYWQEQVVAQKGVSAEASAVVWNAKAGTLRVHGRPFAVGRNSLQGKLLSLLSERRASKALLKEKIWPELADEKSLDNRLHKLVSRLNLKFGEIIGHDGRNYFLRT